ncbi:retrovirus-related pol polyprotein from transposon TNT 1-94, partial [Tanacetum coccineum]
DLISLDTEKLQELKELQGRYGYLFEHLKAWFLSRKSFDTLADHLQEVMVESLPTMVDKHIKEQVEMQVPEQVKVQVPVYVVKRLFLERQQNKEETDKMIAKSMLQEHGKLQAKISSQIQKAIDTNIPSLVDASVRSYMSGHILHVHPAQPQTTYLPEQKYQLYLSMKVDPQLQQQDIAIWLALQMKFETLQVPQTTCRTPAVRPRDQDDPHDDAHPEGENSAKRQKIYEYEAHVTRELSGQVNEKEQGQSSSRNKSKQTMIMILDRVLSLDDDAILMKQVSTRIMEEVSQTIKEAKLKENIDVNVETRCTSEMIINITLTDEEFLKKILSKDLIHKEAERAGGNQKNKARLVAQGYNQQKGIDFDETYAPVARLESIRILLAYAFVYDFKLFQMDIKSAFLNGFINEEVYVAQPPGFVDFEKPNHVFKLKKALYGLKQAPKAWYDRLKALLLDHMYTMGLDEFEMSMMGELNFFLGLQIKQLEDGIFFNQSKYIKEMLKKFGLEDAKPIKTPMMDDPNMTMEEYIKLKEEKARRRALVIDDIFALQDALPCKSQVSTPVNDEIDFRISFDESDDEDYIIICDKNSFSYKMIFVNNLKMDSENDNDKVNMPLLPSPKPTVSYFDDLDFFKDFEKEFPAIVYNDAQTSKLDFLTKPILNP